MLHAHTFLQNLVGCVEYKTVDIMRIWNFSLQPKSHLKPFAYMERVGIYNCKQRHKVYRNVIYFSNLMAYYYCSLECILWTRYCMCIRTICTIYNFVNAFNAVISIQILHTYIFFVCTFLFASVAYVILGWRGTSHRCSCSQKHYVIHSLLCTKALCHDRWISFLIGALCLFIITITDFVHNHN